jgi:hypothetical protein
MKIGFSEKRLRKRFSYALIWTAAPFLTSSIYPKTLPSGSRFPLESNPDQAAAQKPNSKP